MPRQNRGPRLADKLNRDGFWDITFTEAGRSRTRSTGTSNRREADLVLARFVLIQAEQVARGDAPAARVHVPTVAEVLDFYAEKHLPNTTPANQTGAKWWLANLRHSSLGAKLVPALVPVDLTDYARERRDGEVVWRDEQGVARGGRKASAGTIALELKNLRAAVNFAVDNRKFSGLTETTRPKLKVPKGSKPRDVWLTKEQAAKLLAAAHGAKPSRLPPLYRCVAVAMFTGARIETIESLTWDRVHFREFAEVGGVEVATGGWVDFQEPGRAETSKRRGKVNMSAQLAAILWQASKERLRLPGGELSPYVLDTRSSRKHSVRRLAQRTLGFGVGPHVLRHSWATWALEDGVSIGSVAAVLHDSIATVSKTYAHALKGGGQESVDRVVVPVVLNGGRAAA